MKAQVSSPPPREGNVFVGSWGQVWGPEGKADVGEILYILSVRLGTLNSVHTIATSSIEARIKAVPFFSLSDWNSHFGRTTIVNVSIQ